MCKWQSYFSDVLYVDEEKHVALKRAFLYKCNTQIIQIFLLWESLWINLLLTSVQNGPSVGIHKCIVKIIKTFSEITELMSNDLCQKNVHK